MTGLLPNPLPDGLSLEETARAADLAQRIQDLNAELMALLLPTCRNRVTVTDDDLEAIVRGN